MLEKVLKRKNSLRNKRKLRVRGKIFGTAQKPRISLFRSNKHLYAQAINDESGVTLASVDGKKLGFGSTKEEARKTAASFAVVLKEAGIKEAIFDRNGYLYHGVVASFADSLRENGISL